MKGFALRHKRIQKWPIIKFVLQRKIQSIEQELKLTEFKLVRFRYILDESRKEMVSRTGSRLLYLNMSETGAVQH